MASKTGSFLRKSDRQKILKDLHQKGELSPGSAPASVRKEAEAIAKDEPPEPLGETFGTGCLACGEDDDHANLLLCEACNAEFHTYCLEPPLRAVPTGDWFCPECKAALGHFDEDGLDALVNALAPSFTSRFGEVCWAQGGVGFGWWPAFIYDPRLTTGTARELAKKNLGRRHLVYFFGCNDAPFSVLTNAKITKWENGLMEDFHLGKTARGSGQKRTKIFKEALQAATIELAKPIEMRMDWNHSDQPQILPSPQPKKLPPPRKRRRREVSPVKRLSLEKKARSKPKGFPLLKDDDESESQIATQRNLNFALGGLWMGAKKSKNTTEAINPIVEPTEDGELVVKLLQKEKVPIEGLEGEIEGKNNKFPSKNVGFIKMDSRKSSTFCDLRLAIQEQLVPDSVDPAMEWRFFVPGLGPVSRKQETIMGPIYAFLRQTTLDSNLGNGSLLHPLKVFIVEMKSAGTTTATATGESTSACSS